MLLRLMQVEIENDGKPIQVVSNYHSQRLLSALIDDEKFTTEPGIEKLLESGGLVVKRLSQPNGDPFTEGKDINMWTAQKIITVVCVDDAKWVAKLIEHESVGNDLRIVVYTPSMSNSGQDPSQPKDGYDECLFKMITSGYMVTLGPLVSDLRMDYP